MGEEHNDEVKKSVHAATDRDRLLPGEDVNTRHADDARLWVDVYTELLSYKNRLLDVTSATLSEMDEAPARREVVETDRRIMEAERDRFMKRLEFWRGRLAELS